MNQKPDVFELDRNDLHLAINTHLQHLGKIKSGDTTSVQFDLNNHLHVTAEVTVRRKDGHES